MKVKKILSMMLSVILVTNCIISVALATDKTSILNLNELERDKIYAIVQDMTAVTTRASVIFEVDLEENLKKIVSVSPLWYIPLMCLTSMLLPLRISG